MFFCWIYCSQLGFGMVFSAGSTANAFSAPLVALCGTQSHQKEIESAMSSLIMDLKCFQVPFVWKHNFRQARGQLVLKTLWRVVFYEKGNWSDWSLCSTMCPYATMFHLALLTLIDRVRPSTVERFNPAECQPEALPMTFATCNPPAAC